MLNTFDGAVNSQLARTRISQPVVGVYARLRTLCLEHASLRVCWIGSADTARTSACALQLCLHHLRLMAPQGLLSPAVVSLGLYIIMNDWRSTQCVTVTAKYEYESLYPPGKVNRSLTIQIYSRAALHPGTPT